MSVLVVDGLYSFTWYGSAGAGQIGIDRGGAKVLPFLVFQEVVDLFREQSRRGGQGQGLRIASSGSAKSSQLFMMVVSGLDQILKVKRAGSVLNDHVAEFDFADANASDG
ncbi:hypothetical protein JH282_10245 [Xanthomonas campestris pv. campestris]|nr:hypothetical protein JH282_10245 [Xanthomonas campestris pv. campestris]